MLSEEHPEIGVTAPAGGAAVTLLLTVADVDAVIDRAVATGATLTRPAADYDHGRNGVVVDPFESRWMISRGRRRRPPLHHRPRCPRAPVAGRRSPFATVTSATCRSSFPTPSVPCGSTPPSSAGRSSRAAACRVARYAASTCTTASGESRSRARCSCALPSTTSAPHSNGSAPQAARRRSPLPNPTDSCRNAGTMTGFLSPSSNLLRTTRRTVAPRPHPIRVISSTSRWRRDRRLRQGRSTGRCSGGVLARRRRGRLAG